MPFTDPHKQGHWYTLTIYGNDLNINAQVWSQNTEQHVDYYILQLADILNSTGKGWNMDIIKSSQMDQWYPDPNA